MSLMLNLILNSADSLVIKYLNILRKLGRM